MTKFWAQKEKQHISKSPNLCIDQIPKLKHSKLSDPALVFENLKTHRKHLLGLPTPMLTGGAAGSIIQFWDLELRNITPEETCEFFR
jgi:hypothetical protein